MGVGRRPALERWIPASGNRDRGGGEENEPQGLASQSLVMVM